jgi:hypothetical protein
MEHTAMSFSFDPDVEMQDPEWLPAKVAKTANSAAEAGDKGQISHFSHFSH